jgi:cyclopropane-fatty-acyl-phospholipid synthase
MLDRVVASGLVPEPLLRLGIRAVCALRLVEERGRDRAALLEQLRAGELAVATDAANAQHYEVPAAFFTRVLGPHLKYSSCYWPPGVTTLAAAEAAMLELSCARAGLADGQRVLDLGCGWGSASLWIAARYPCSRVTAVSNSRTQRDFIVARAAERGLTNLEVRTADVRALELPAASFDRVVSIEMLEHVRNYEHMFARIARWLRSDGQCFVHVFAHRHHAYPFDDRGASDWMAREFFTGGMMPSASLFHAFDRDLAVADQWHVSGTHYARTAEAWHDNLCAHRAELEAIVGTAGWHKWRVFFLACAELFGYAGGREWLVAHYRFKRQR